MIASALTRYRGEVVFKIGSRPAHDKLFSGEPIAVDSGAKGTPRSVEEVELLCQGLADIVDEIGGKVRMSHGLLDIGCHVLIALKTSTLYRPTDGPPRAALLLRLPPPSVALTPEVRCAVVGNVDSGKSTTLGVLTRGASVSAATVTSTCT